MNFPTPKVVVSKCLGFESCRYNGQKLLDPVRLVKEKNTTILFQPASGDEVKLYNSKTAQNSEGKGGAL